MQTPLLVISQRHIPIVRLQQQTTIPFIMQQQLHIEPARLEQRPWSVAHAISSSQAQLIFIPPAHFSILMVHRGTMRQLAVGVAVGTVMPAGLIGGIVFTGPIIAVFMASPPHPRQYL